MTVSDAPTRGEAALDVLLSRTSNNMLTEPVPEGRDLELIIQAATHAPDHGRNRLWRVVAINVAAREDFVDVVVEATKDRKPEAAADELKTMRNKFLMQRMSLAVGAQGHVGKYNAVVRRLRWKSKS